MLLVAVGLLRLDINKMAPLHWTLESASHTDLKMCVYLYVHIWLSFDFKRECQEARFLHNEKSC